MAQHMPFGRGVRSAADTMLIAQCCICGLLQAKKRLPTEPDRWMTSRTYEKTYGVKPSASRVTHTYCPGCHTDFMQRVKSSRPAISLSSD
jgi:hypothetical protein